MYKYNIILGYTIIQGTKTTTADCSLKNLRSRVIKGKLSIELIGLPHNLED